MKKLNELIECDYDIEIEAIVEDSRVVADNYLFCCIEGLTVDGHKFIRNAYENGAVAAIVSKTIETDVPIPLIQVENTKDAMSGILAKFYDRPLDKLKLIGVTGTDGKTTTSTILSQLLNMFGDCGLIGSNGASCKSFQEATQFTTPPETDLYHLFDRFVKSNCEYVSMEVSSDGLSCGRLNHIEYDISILTNLTRDHLDNHKTIENYRRSKAKLFEQTKKDGVCIINKDDSNSKFFIDRCNGEVLTYGIQKKADVMAKDIILGNAKTKFTVVGPFGEYRVETSLPGMFNVYNLLAAISACYKLGLDVAEVTRKVIHVTHPKGRVEFVNYGQPYKIVVDHAHTPNALKNLLEYVQLITEGNVIVVTGSAGGRDKGKRPEMGKIISELSDHIIFTMDDPRFEDPNDIIDDLTREIPDKRTFERVINRTNAIRKALTMAGPNDTVAIVGKGNDSYMPVMGKTLHFNDFEEIDKIMKELIVQD